MKDRPDDDPMHPSPEADYQLHQIRFLLAFIMITIGTLALNSGWHVEETFTTMA